MTKITANYGKYSVEIEGTNMVEALKQLAVAEDLFGDTVALGRDQNGQILRHENVIVTHRVTDNGHSYFGMRAVGEGPLRGYTREIGQYQAPRLGECFTKRKCPDTHEPGLNGWGKYRQQGNQNSQGGNSGYQNGGGNNNYQPQPQQQSYQQPQQQHAPVSNEEIPF